MIHLQLNYLGLNKMKLEYTNQQNAINQLSFNNAHSLLLFTYGLKIIFEDADNKRVSKFHSTRGTSCPKSIEKYLIDLLNSKYISLYL